jgi:hypothetical protein
MHEIDQHEPAFRHAAYSRRKYKSVGTALSHAIFHSTTSDVTGFTRAPESEQMLNIVYSDKLKPLK